MAPSAASSPAASPDTSGMDPEVAEAFVRKYLADTESETSASIVAEYLRQNPGMVANITNKMMMEQQKSSADAAAKGTIHALPMPKHKTDPRSKFQNLLKLSAKPSRRLRLLISRTRWHHTRTGQPEQQQGVLAANELSSDNPDTKRLINLPHEHLMMELIRDIANEMDVTLLCVKVIRNVLLLVQAERASLFLVREQADGEKRLVSLLFDVTIDSTLEQIVARDKERFEVPFKKGILGTVAATKIPIICNDPYKEPMFNAEVDKKSGFVTKCIMCAPLLDADGELLGVAEVLNKSPSPSNTSKTKAGFTIEDQDTFLSYLMFCALGFINAELFQYSLNEFKANRTLLRLAKEIFCEGFNINRTGCSILSEAARAFGVSDYVLYLVDALDNPWNRYTLYKVGERQKLTNAVDTLNMGQLSRTIQSPDDLKFVQRLRVSRKENEESSDGTSNPRTSLGVGGDNTTWSRIQKKVRSHMNGKMDQENWRASQLTKLNMRLGDEEFLNDGEDDVKIEVEQSTDAKHLTEGRFVHLAKNCVIQNLHIDVVNNENDKAGWPEHIEALGEDEKTTNVHSVLVKPVYDSTQQHVLGVMIIVNRNPSHVFNQFERERLMTFFLYAGLGLQFAFIHERMMITLAKQEVALEVLAFHRTADEQEMRKFFNRYPNIPLLEQIQTSHLLSISYNDLPLHEDETTIHVFNMFKMLRATENFKIDDKKLARFLLTVRQSYRPVRYHNWRHGLNVCQSMFVLLKGAPKLERFFEEHVCVYMLIATLCHDLDHRGTNNQFQTKTSTPLAFLYSTSTLEKHHFDQTMLILNAEDTNLFSNMPTETYFEAMAVIEHAIISTDLALYFKKKAKFLELCASPEFKAEGEKFWMQPANNQMLRAMLMTACDLSAICKPWEYQSRVAKIVYEEFFEQGDIEKKEFGATADMFNRDNKDQLPKMQIGFIDFVCKPLYEALNAAFPHSEDMLNGAIANRGNWADEKAKMDARREAKMDIISWNEDLDWPEGHAKHKGGDRPIGEPSNGDGMKTARSRNNLAGAPTSKRPAQPQDGSLSAGGGDVPQSNGSRDKKKGIFSCCGKLSKK